MSICYWDWIIARYKELTRSMYGVNYTVNQITFILFKLMRARYFTEKKNV